MVAKLFLLSLPLLTLLPDAACCCLVQAGAMVLAAGTAAGLLLGVEPLGLGLEGVWCALALLMVSRLGTMVWRYQSEQGPLPPSSAGAVGGGRCGWQAMMLRLDS